MSWEHFSIKEKDQGEKKEFRIKENKYKFQVDIRSDETKYT